jgi:hypothetical protein
VESVSAIPVDTKNYKRKTTYKIVKRSIRKLVSGQQFGMEEIMVKRPIRIVQAKVIAGGMSSKYASIIQVSKKDFLNGLGRQEVRACIKRC